MLYPVTNPSWTAIAQRMGLQGLLKWSLADVVMPVSLVDSGITLSATITPTLIGTPSSAGELIAPAANTRMADTGALAGGPWNFVVWFSASEAAMCRVRRRNAADAADIWSFRAQVNSGGTFPGSMTFRATMAASERLVVENTNVGTAGAVYQASIFATAG